jgi:peptidylprolyl isomerase
VSPRFAILRAGAALTAAVALIAGCSSASSTGTSTTTQTTDLSAVKVTGAENAKPTVSFKAPFVAGKTDRKVLDSGSGSIVTAGQRITINYVGVNGADGKEFDTSFGKSVATFTLDDKSIIKGLVTGLAGVTVGSRVLIAVPPADGYGTTGAPSAGIGPTDTLLFVVDVKSTATVLTRAAGTAVAPKKGLPKVVLNKSTGAPTITVPKGKAPTKLVVQPLIIGKGAKVAKDQTITVNYTGVIWPGGKQFDSSWSRGAPDSFEIGAGKVIAGWDEGLVGQTVGSQLLLVIPPDKGYGAAGSPTAGIKATDTLVFVVDILGADAS